MNGKAGHILEIGENRLPQQEQLVGAELQGDTREVLSNTLGLLQVCVCWVQGKPLVERLKGKLGHLLGMSETSWPQREEQLVGAKLQGEAREALIAAMAVSPISKTLIPIPTLFLALAVALAPTLHLSLTLSLALPLTLAHTLSLIPSPR